MNIGLLTRNQNAWCPSRLIEAFAERNVGLRPFRFERLVAAIAAAPPVALDDTDIVEKTDALLIRPIGRGSLDEVIFRLDLLHSLTRAGLPIVNHPASIEKAVDKYRALDLLSESGIRVPRTIVTEDVTEALRAFRRFGCEAIIKPVFGSRGIGAARISNEDVAERVFRTLRFHKHVLYVQEFIQHGSRDIRLLVVGSRVVAGMHRIAESWKTNVSRGAKPVLLKPTDEMRELAVRSASVIGCEISGVDLMEGPNGLFVCEINSQPGWKGLQTTTNVNIAGEIADYMIGKAKR